MKTICFTLLASSLLCSGAVVLEMTEDKPLTATATLLGTINPSDFPQLGDSKIPFGSDGGYYRYSRLDLGSVGMNWNVSGDLTWEVYFDANDTQLDSTYDLSLFGQHKVAPHPREASMGLELLVYYDNLRGIPATSSRPENTFDHLPHRAGPHSDSMMLAVDDLNGNAPGVLSFRDQISVTARLNHPVPDHSTTLGLLGVALSPLVGFRRLASIS